MKDFIDKVKGNFIYWFLYSLSIYYFGKKVFKFLVVEIGYVFELKDWIVEDFINIKDVGLIVVENVICFFEVFSNVEMLEEMEILGVNFS